MGEFNGFVHRQKMAEAHLEEAGAVLEGHFVYAAEDHGNAYVAKDETIKRPEILARITWLMAANLAETLDPDDIDMLGAAAPCGSIIAARMSEHLEGMWGKTPGLVFAEKVPKIAIDEATGEPKIEEELKLKRNFDQEIIGKRIHIVEDVVNSGMTVLQLKDLFGSFRGVEVVGASAEYSRTPSAVNAETLGVSPWLPLVEKELTKTKPQDCDMCEDLEQFPIRTDRGHGAKFLAELAVWDAALKA
jgi:orotate phosphoribosyltransferase